MVDVIRVYKRKNDMNADPYTVIIGRSIYGMSSNPNSPQGVNMYYGEVGKGWTIKQLNKQFGDKIPMSKVPEEIKIAIKARLR